EARADGLQGRLGRLRRADGGAGAEALILPPRVIPEAAQRLSGIHAHWRSRVRTAAPPRLNHRNRCSWVPDKRFALSGMTPLGCGQSAFRTVPAINPPPSTRLGASGA